MLDQSLRFTGAFGIGLPLAGLNAEGKAPAADRKLKVVVAGGHPDDPESGCGGTIARYSDLSHQVVVLYLTRGEAGIEGKPAPEAAAIRTAECRKACGILKVKPVFAGQIDGSTEVNAARYDEFRSILDAEQPDVVFTHWPIDIATTGPFPTSFTMPGCEAAGSSSSIISKSIRVDRPRTFTPPTTSISPERRAASGLPAMRMPARIL